MAGDTLGRKDMKNGFQLRPSQKGKHRLSHLSGTGTARGVTHPIQPASAFIQAGAGSC